MKQKILAVNNISGILFFISSMSLLIFPFLEQENGLPVIAFIIAGIFWICLLFGSALQVLASMMIKRLKQKRKKAYIERKLAIPISVFAVILILILCFFKNNLLFLAIDAALLLSSIELYFYLKRRNSV